MFRPPRYPLPLSILVGNGAQLCAMTAVTLGRHHYIFCRKIQVHSNSNSFCLDGFFVSVQSWIACYSHDGLLVLLWQVGTSSASLFPPTYKLYDYVALEVIVLVGSMLLSAGQTEGKMLS